ncbi:hypothetical protein BCON_0043g00140 [Botryotinia convoluta]|uniref:Rhodopsin domain-containing protein n=1 Tax=Botryotinia convoluta TaxID=54673 RepID=A0A4Z1IDS7_9HELO|nr:hypothetical protein BCON_0043g00140 [Botryotinia convoluta]
MATVTRRVSPHAVPLIVISTVFQTIAIILVVLRFIAKRANNSFGLDDWFAFLALAFSSGLYTTGILICTIGSAGYHAGVLPPENIERFLLIVYVDNIFYALTLSTIKFSVLVMYRRIFSPVHAFRYALYAVGMIVMGWMIGVLFAQIFTCTPVDGAWSLTAMATAKCIDQTKFYYGNAISNLLTDVIILCLPMPMIWKLNMTAHKKVVLSGVFLLGGFVCVSSIIRIISLAKIDYNDITYTLVDVGIWTSCETPLAITCACLPTLPAYIKSWRQKVGGSRVTKSETALRSLRSKRGTEGHASKNTYETLDEENTPLSTDSGVQKFIGGGEQIHVSHEYSVESSQRV